MSKIKNGGLDQYGAKPFEEQQFGTTGVERVKLLCMTWKSLTLFCWCIRAESSQRDLRLRLPDLRTPRPPNIRRRTCFRRTGRDHPSSRLPWSRWWGWWRTTRHTSSVVWCPWAIQTWWSNGTRMEFSWNTVSHFRVVHGLGVNSRVGLGRDFSFWWVGSGRGSETAEAQKLIIFTSTELVDTDDHRFSWVVCWVGSWVQIFTMVWVGMGWIEEIGLTDNYESFNIFRRQEAPLYMLMSCQWCIVGLLSWSRGWPLVEISPNALRMFFSAVWRAIVGLIPLDLIPTRDTDYSLIPWRQNCYRFSELIIIYEIRM